MSLEKLSVLAILLLPACHPVREIPFQSNARPDRPTHTTSSHTEPSVIRATPAPQPSAPLPSPALPRISRKTIAAIQFEGVSFDSRSHRLKVIDQPNGPGSRFPDAEQLAIHTNSLLAINAGFFTPEGKPLGLVISNSRITGAWNSSSSLGSGIFLETASGDTMLIRRQSRAAILNPRELIQAGPMLIENGKSVSGLDPLKSAIRSIILHDGRSRWWIGKTSPCTLAELSATLQSASPDAWAVRKALNLDGGRSTDLYISSKIPGGPVNRRSLFNRPVRNFLILTPR